MLPLGRWVLRTACMQAAAWRALLGDQPVTLSVNLSSAQFADAGLVADVGTALAASELPPERLVLELTETAMLRDPEAIADRMLELKRLGVRLAVDDFGTGNASLRNLARFPIDVLKVDRSFVNRIGIDKRQTAIAASIIRLGQSLEMLVVAEGIETPDQLAQLLVLGCGYGQGFMLGRPAEPDQLERLLSQLVPGGDNGNGHGPELAPGPLAPVSR